MHRMTAFDARTTSETLERAVICIGVQPEFILGRETAQDIIAHSRRVKRSLQAD